MSEAVREVVANAILFEIKDPRVKNVTVTRAEVAADLQHAKVYVSIMGTEKQQQLSMHGLKSAAGYIQTKVADRLTTRFVPHITFVLDEGVKKSVEIGRIIREESEQLARDRAAAGHPDATPDADDDDDDELDESDETDETDTDIDDVDVADANAEADVKPAPSPGDVAKHEKPAE